MTESLLRAARIVWTIAGPWAVLLIVWEFGLHFAAVAFAVLMVIAMAVAAGQVIGENRATTGDCEAVATRKEVG